MHRDLYESDHEAFREIVQAYVKREVTPHLQRWVQEHIIDRQAWLAAGKQALIGLPIPERFGGAGTDDFRFRCVLTEELARVCAGSLSGVIRGCVTSTPPDAAGFGVAVPVTATTVSSPQARAISRACGSRTTTCASPDRSRTMRNVTVASTRRRCTQPSIRTWPPGAAWGSSAASVRARPAIGTDDTVITSSSQRGPGGVGGG